MSRDLMRKDVHTSDYPEEHGPTAEKITYASGSVCACAHVCVHVCVFRGAEKQPVFLTGGIMKLFILYLNMYYFL